jgi:putative PEP-CTERM system histidine kinase
VEEGVQAISVLSYGMSMVLYGAFAVFHLASWRTSLRSRALVFVASISTVWSGACFCFAISGYRVFLSVSLYSDIFRYGAWFGFLLILLMPDRSQSKMGGGRWNGLASVATSLFLGGILLLAAAQSGVASTSTMQRLVLLDSLGITVFSLMLLEQLWRCVESDLRWSLKPLCLGWGGAVLYDLYLYSDALLFNRIDSDAFSIRGFVHALVVPLIALSTSRSKAWKKRLVLSQRAALQSATLVAVGIYLLFMSAAGYYVRYFGGNWGKAFQLALIFAALLLLGALALSGSMRAKVRVFIGKHFFSYRYDVGTGLARYQGTGRHGRKSCRRAMA